MPKHKYTKGALVFAKVKGYPPWPARITGLGSKDRYKVYFYGTYETATLRSEDIWPYNPDTKEKFATKNMKRKGYSEGIDQIENTPEIAPVEGELSELDTTADISLQSPLVIHEPAAPAPAPAKKPTKSTPAGKNTPASKTKETPKSAAEPTPKSAVRTSKRKASEVAEGETPAKKAAAAATPGPADENGESEEKLSRSGRVIKPKKLGVGNVASPRPAAPAEAETEKAPGKSLKKETEKSSPVKSDPADPRRMWVKVKATGDLIEINLDKDRPESFASNEAKLEWEMASARKALKFKRRVESGEFVPPEIKKKMEEKEAMSEEDKAILGREKMLEKRKTKLKWLKIEQRLVDLDIAVKTSLHMETPVADQCISALDELNELALAPLMLKKQPDIVTTIKRLRRYIGPQNYNSWADKTAKQKMEKDIQVIKAKAEQIYEKFKSYFVFQEGNKTFWEAFDEEVMEFKNKTEGLDEAKILSMISDPTKPLSSTNPLSDDEEDEL